jgi:hypothetical protein
MGPATAVRTGWNQRRSAAAGWTRNLSCPTQHGENQRARSPDRLMWSPQNLGLPT